MTRQELKQKSKAELSRMAADLGLPVCRDDLTKDDLFEMIAARLGLKKPVRSAWQPGDSIPH